MLFEAIEAITAVVFPSTLLLYHADLLYHAAFIYHATLLYHATIFFLSGLCSGYTQFYNVDTWSQAFELSTLPRTLPKTPLTRSGRSWAAVSITAALRANARCSLH